MRARLCLLILTGHCLGLGCGSKAQHEPTGDAGHPSRGAAVFVIALPGASYLHDADTLSRPHSACGMLPLGDVNGDGVGDLAVSLHYKSARTPAEQTAIEAFSGRDGARLWQSRGRHSPQGDGYQFKHLAPAGDHDGDGLSDIYARGGTRLALVLSSKTGAIIKRFPIESNGVFAAPLLARDSDGDHVPELIFVHRKHDKSLVAAEVFSGTDMKRIAEHQVLSGADVNAGWALPVFHDIDGDGVPESLVHRPVGRDEERFHTHNEFAVISGRDYHTILKTFRSPRPRLIAATSYAACGDINRDGVKDFVFAAHAGAGIDRMTSFLRAVSASDGAVLWEVTGNELPGGRSSFSVDAKTREKKEHPRDVEFGSPVTVVDDLDGDGIEEVATVARSLQDGKSTPSLLLFSGATGKLLAALSPDPGQGRLDGYRAQLASTDHRGPNPRIAVAGRNPKGEPMIAIFLLSKLR